MIEEMKNLKVKVVSLLSTLLSKIINALLLMQVNIKIFFLDNPDSDPNGWLEDYYESKLGNFTGYFIDDQLVSVSDAPDMAYLENKIQHTGIST